MDDRDQPGDYGLIMPFVVCKDQGGPYDGDAFVAGYVAGILDTLLPIVRPHGVTVERYVVPELVPQLDLLAMRHGFKLTAEPWDEHPDEWTFVTFTPA
jgi:hypothetical protein